METVEKLTIPIMNIDGASVTRTESAQELWSEYLAVAESTTGNMESASTTNIEVQTTLEYHPEQPSGDQVADEHTEIILEPCYNLHPQLRDFGKHIFRDIAPIEQ